jgi:hypothetical protein
MAEEALSYPIALPVNALPRTGFLKGTAPPSPQISTHRIADESDSFEWHLAPRSWSRIARLHQPEAFSRPASFAIIQDALKSRLASISPRLTQGGSSSAVWRIAQGVNSSLGLIPLTANNVRIDR